MKILMHRYLTIFLWVGVLASFFIFSHQAKASVPCQGAIISEMMPNPTMPLTDEADEWIEISNTGENELDISGCILKDQKGTLKEFKIPAGTKIGPNGYAVFYSRVTKISLNNTEDGAVLLSSDGTEVFKTALYKNAPDGESFSFDGEIWAWTKTPTPNAENVFDVQEEVLGGGDCDGVIVSEMMPDPGAGYSDSKDEWIEIFNTTDQELDITGCVIADMKGSAGKYTLKSAKIPSGGFLVFYSKDTHISLNNDGDGVKILSANNTVFESQIYSNVLTNMSFAYDGEAWSWTATPTPGRENILTAIEATTKTTQKKTTQTTKKPAKTTKTTKKPSAKKVAAKNQSEVKGDSDSSESLWGGETDLSKPKTITDKYLGYAVIILSFVFLLGYTFWTKKDKFSGIFRDYFKRFRRDS